MNIETANIQDIPTIIKLWERANLLISYNDPETDIKAALSTPTSTLLVAKIDGKIIGTAMTGYDGHRGWVYYVAVEPEHQKQGYGKKMIEAAESWLKSLGVHKVHLLIRKNNSIVQSFYHKIGYENIDVIVMKKTF